MSTVDVILPGTDQPIAVTDIGAQFARAVTVTVATPAVVTDTAHGFVDRQPLTLSTTGALPTGLSAATKYFVLNSTANTYQLALTAGGAAINTTGTQSGTHTVTPIVYAQLFNLNNGNVNNQALMLNSAPVAVASDQKWQTGMSPRGFSAAFSTLTRPANTTAYTGLDSISDSATAGSVTPLSATLSDTNDDPLTVTEILISSTDTGLAGKRIRAYLFNSDPTASTGVGAGDNVAYSQKKAGYIGSFSGVMETGFSDGTVGRLVPSYADGAASGTPHAAAGGFVVTKPTSGAKTLFIQYQAVDGFTPSASSTTIVGTARGFQGRAA